MHVEWQPEAREGCEAERGAPAGWWKSFCDDFSFEIKLDRRWIRDWWIRQGRRNAKNGSKVSTKFPKKSPQAWELCHEYQFIPLTRFDFALFFLPSHRFLSIKHKQKKKRKNNITHWGEQTWKQSFNENTSQINNSTSLQRQGEFDVDGWRKKWVSSRRFQCEKGLPLVDKAAKTLKLILCNRSAQLITKAAISSNDFPPATPQWQCRDGGRQVVAITISQLLGDCDDCHGTFRFTVKFRILSCSKSNSKLVRQRRKPRNWQNFLVVLEPPLNWWKTWWRNRTSQDSFPAVEQINYAMASMRVSTSSPKSSSNIDRKLDPNFSLLIKTVKQWSG